MNVRRTSPWLAMLVLALLIAGCASPQSPATTSIAGKVSRSDTGRPNAETHIALYDSTVSVDNLASARPAYETTTNAEGQYKFPDVPAGSYLILVSLPGSDPSLSNCTKVPKAGSEWLFHSLSYDAVGNPQKVVYRTVDPLKIAAGENLKRDFSWTCE